MSDAIRVVSLFCGLGGADLGLYAAADELGVEVEVVDAIDSWEPAVRVYNANQRHAVARVADVKQMTRSDFPEHDLILGGPPCQGHSIAGKKLGRNDPRDCLDDFVRLAGDTPYIMENVRKLLINAPWSEQVCAADFGDVTSRKRWFYSNYLLHIVPTPSSRRLRDIRDHAEDDHALNMVLPGQSFRLLVNKRGSKPKGKYRHPREHRLKIKVRGNRDNLSYAVDEDGFLPSLVAQAWHGNTIAELAGARNPSLLEMARAHSLPDSWDWAGATKEQRGKMIANMWPARMAKAVCKAMLQALIYEREQAV